MIRPFAVLDAALDAAALTQSVVSHGAGATVTFVGHVRAHSRGRAVTQLEYEAYPEMAEAVFARIAGEARERFDVAAIAIHHRIGKLSVGEVSVAIAVAAGHRPAAFDACRYVIDTLKAQAPIWKKEHGPDGSTWVADRP